MVKKFNCYLVKKETKEDVIQALLHVPDMATGESEKQPLIWSFQALQSPVFTEHILENNLSHEQWFVKYNYSCVDSNTIPFKSPIK